MNETLSRVEMDVRDIGPEVLSGRNYWQFVVSKDYMDKRQRDLVNVFKVKKKLIDASATGKNTKAKGRTSKLYWSNEEDAIVEKYVKEHGILGNGKVRALEKYWEPLKKQLEAMSVDWHREDNAMTQRWNNFLDPQVSKEEFPLPEEVPIIISTYEAQRTRGKISHADAAKALVGRTQNQLKNFYSSKVLKRSKDH